MRSLCRPLCRTLAPRPRPIGWVRPLCTSAPPPTFEDRLAEASPTADASLRGVGQVVFCNSPVSGGVFLAALASADPWLASLATAGVTSATVSAKVTGLDASAVSAGLAGYNGCLVGCAFSVFLGAPAWSSPVALATLLAAAATAPLSAALKPACGSVPQWTWAFNLTTLSVLGYVRPFAEAAPPPAEVPLTAVEWACAPLVGVSQIFVVNSPLSGALLLGGIGYYSPGCAAHTLLGSVVGVATAVGMGAPASEIGMGLWGFNPALTALAVSVFFVPSPQSYALAAGGAAATTAVFGGLKTAFGTGARPEKNEQ